MNKSEHKSMLIPQVLQNAVNLVAPRLMRTVTGAVLLVVVLILLFFANTVLWIIATIVVMLAGWEWAKLAPKNKNAEESSQKTSEKADREKFVRITEAHWLVVALFFVMLAYYFIGVGSLILIPLFLPISLLLFPKSEQHEIIGIACLATFGVGLLEIYEVFTVGMLPWVFIIVIAFDTAAFFGGKAIRGPLLWREVSPDKRWSGLVAGLLVASFCGTIWLTVFVENNIFAGIAVDEAGGKGFETLISFGASLLVALAAQAGDLAESRMKRRVGVKDSGRILPGHGGILDRIDGYLCAVPMAFLLLTIQKTSQTL